MADLFARPFTPAPVGFTGSALDRADDIRRDPQALFAARLHPAARWLPFDDLRPLLADEALAWIGKADFPGEGPEVFLGFDGDAPRFAVAMSAVGLDGETRDVRAAAMTLPADQAAIVAQGRALLDWHGRHRFCANCGAETAMAKAGYARECAVDSGGCGTDHFPRTDPVVIMLALDGDRCLLGRQPHFPKGFMSALAGFVEPGESLEEAVRRELYEESGIAADRVAYVASQPWPFPSSLMVGAFAEATTTEIRLDTHELEAAAWFSKDEVKAALAGDGPFSVPPPMAIAHSLLRTWADAV